MIRVALWFALLYLSFAANAQQTSAQREKLEAKQGIRDIKLNTPKSLYNDLYNVNNEFPCGDMMQRKEENLSFGKAKVKAIRYLYLNDTLKAIRLDFEYSKGNDFNHLVGVLTQLYGPMNKINYDSSIPSMNTVACKKYAWFAETFTIETHFYGFERQITFIKNDFFDCCKKFYESDK